MEVIDQKPIRVGKRLFEVKREVSPKGRPGKALMAFHKDILVATGYTRAELIKAIERRA